MKMPALSSRHPVIPSFRRGVQEVKAPAVGEAAARLPWLSPGAASLVALGRLPFADAWAQVRTDPGAVLLLLRYGQRRQPPGVRRQESGVRNQSRSWLTPESCILTPVLEAALRHLDAAGPGFVDWQRPAVQPVYQASLTYAEAAHALAGRGGCDPQAAWVAGLLAPLGWLAACAVAPEQVAACLADPELAADPARVQQRHWGWDQAAVARRLARRWRLPRWLAAVVGHLDLPADSAPSLGADPALFHSVQLAVASVQHHHAGLRLPLDVRANGEVRAAVPGDVPPSANGANGHAHAPEVRGPSGHGPPRVHTWEDPATTPLLRDLLLLAVENRRLQDAPVLKRLEHEVDSLHRALREQRAAEEQRLRLRKLSALAELAAGAGHEINNPLAVISGQAQYLLHHEGEPARQQALQAIVTQAQRIHQILNELRQFARPPRPQKEPVDLLSLVHDVLASLAEVAAGRRVQLLCPLPEQTARVQADPRQVHLALGCLVRNGIEAAPADGWVSVRIVPIPQSFVAVVVEDSGPGPQPNQREHLFDPFYSGRQAGRGRGLGLPTAWRLAREHGGDVRFEENPGGATRFVMTLPTDPAAGGREHDGIADCGLRIADSPSNPQSAALGAGLPTPPKPPTAGLPATGNPQSAIRNPQSQEPALPNDS
jgi:signal transduction histidine kinase